MASKDPLRNTMKHMQRSAKFGVIICRIIEVILIIWMLFHIASLIMAYTGHETLPWLNILFMNNSLYRLLSPIQGDGQLQIISSDILETISSRSRVAAGIFSSLGATFVLWLFIRKIEKILKSFTEDVTPFNIKAAKRFRLFSFLFLALVFYNPVLGIVSFTISFCFSYIMEYGGYLQKQADETNRIQEEIIVSFAEITENKSGQTGQHIKRVSEYSRILAEQMGYDEESCEAIRIASTMHDVGKLMIPTEILEKPGRLTNEEYETIKSHTTYGGQLLENVEGEELQLSRTIALQHHERYDGNGYPAQLKGEEISQIGRIVSVADVYDALTSKRSYKDAWTEDDAYQEILKGKGTQFDPRVVEAFEQVHEKFLEVRRSFAD